MAFVVHLIAGAFMLLLTGLVRPLQVVVTEARGSVAGTVDHRGSQWATFAPRRTRAP